MHTQATDQQEQEDWGPLVTRVRKAARLTKVAFANLMQVHVDTLSRWEAGKNRPEKADVVGRFAQAFGVDLNYALKAAGLMPASHGPAGIPPELDEPGVATIRAASLPEWLKAELIEELKAEAAEDEARRARRAKRMIEVADRRGLNRETGA